MSKKTMKTLATKVRELREDGFSYKEIDQILGWQPLGTATRSGRFYLSRKVKAITNR